VSILSGPRQSRTRSHLRALGACALVFVLGATLAAAQQPEEDVNAKTEKIGTTYRLTEPVMAKVAALWREILALARRNPAIFETADTADTNKSAHPALQAIYARVGLTEDEYEKFTIAMGYAQMGSWAASLSGDAARNLEQAPPVVRANVAFLKTHEAALKAMGSDVNELQQLHEKRTGIPAEAKNEMELKVTGAARAGVNSEIELEVTGGPRAGRYAAKVTEGGCSHGLTKPGAWGNQYSIDTKDPKQFSSLQLIVPDAKGAAGGTGNFHLMVTFGPLLSLLGPGGTHYNLGSDPDREQEGEDILKLDDQGSGATVTFGGKTKDGVGLKGTIKCHTVMRMTPAR
jgi:hypothetical protein